MPLGAGLRQLCDASVGHDDGRGVRVYSRRLSTQRVSWQKYQSLIMSVEDPRRPRALVIDDNESVCEALCELLMVMGFEAEGTMSGTQGLALFDQRAFDLVTTDLMMPGMTGWEVVEAVRTRAPATQIIMITGSVSNLDRDRARAMRLALLLKPLRLEELRRAIESDRSSMNVPVIGRRLPG